MKGKSPAWALVFALAGFCCSGCHRWIRRTHAVVPVPKASAQFVPCEVGQGRQAHRFTVYLPPGYTPKQLWPVITALHGSGECGTDGIKPSQAGLGDALRCFPDRYPCVVVFPQSAHDHRYWTDNQAVVLAELDQTVQKYHGDKQRLYLTGYSLGGAGAWFLAARDPGKFAALAPVCGRIAMQPARAFDPEVHGWVTSRDPYAAVAGHVGSLPVWVFHGQDDPIVPVNESRRITAALQERGGNVRFTELPGVGHDAWTEAYANPALPLCLFSHSHSERKSHAP